MRAGDTESAFRQQLQRMRKTHQRPNRADYSAADCRQTQACGRRRFEFELFLGFANAVDPNAPELHSYREYLPSFLGTPGGRLSHWLEHAVPPLRRDHCVEVELVRKDSIVIAPHW